MIIMINKKLFMAAILLVLSIALVAGCTGTSVSTVKAGDNVTVDYTGWFDNGTIFDTSNATIAQQAGIYNAQRPYEPISFITGSGEVIQGFDNGVMGMKIGESKNITLTPAQAYGEYNASLIQPVPISILSQSNITPHVNDTLYYNMQPVKVVGIPNNTTVLIDFNSPMAGKTLHFMLKVLNIQHVSAT